MIDEKFISERIAALRTARNISARDMSLSLGQSTNYINSIENKHSLPSMTMFLYICDFLGISPGEFFDEENESPELVAQIAEAVKGLDREELELVLALVIKLAKKI